MKILVTGASGFVGGRVVERAAADHEVHALWRRHEPPKGATPHQIDLDDGSSLTDLVRSVRPDVVVHTAYEMAAGAEPNLRWSRNVVRAAETAGARLIFVSTDLVFDGKRGWYREDEPTNPTLPYGEWKARLEKEVLAANGIVARTSLVWGIDPVADHTEKLVLEPLRGGRTPRLFEDEWRTPTEVHDLADGLTQAAALRGPLVLHLAGPERLSRLAFGKMLARYFGFDPDLLPPVKRADVAPDRPADTSLLSEVTRRYVSTVFRAPSRMLGLLPDARTGSGGASRD